MYAQAWASVVERHPENNQISSGELCRKDSRLRLVENGNKLASISAGTSRNLKLEDAPRSSIGLMEHCQWVGDAAKGGNRYSES